MLMLEQKDFIQLVKNAPLFAIDLVVLNEKNQILLGKRLNAPAKGDWFVPGGRVFKNEALAKAFERITATELGWPFPYDQAILLGIFEHFYPDSIFGDLVSTHYINATHLLELKKEVLEPPNDQHQSYRWLNLDEIERDGTVHQYSKAFITALRNKLSV